MERMDKFPLQPKWPSSVVLEKALNLTIKESRQKYSLKYRRKFGSFIHFGGKGIAIGSI